MHVITLSLTIFLKKGGGLRFFSKYREKTVYRRTFKSLDISNEYIIPLNMQKKNCVWCPRGGARAQCPIWRTKVAKNGQNLGPPGIADISMVMNICWHRLSFAKKIRCQFFVLRMRSTENRRKNAQIENLTVAFA